MKPFRGRPGENDLLKAERGFSCEQRVVTIESGGLVPDVPEILDVIEAGGLTCVATQADPVTPKAAAGATWVKDQRINMRSSELNKVADMRRKRFLNWGVALSLAMAAAAGAAAEVETPDLIIRDATGSLPAATFERLATKVGSTLAEILKFWSADTRTREWGKIVVEIEKPLPKATSSVFLWGKDKGKRARIVKVYGGGEYPHQLAHKLTSAVYPNADKLIRNMMGEASEKRFGNPVSFPMCGFKTDEWVMALLQTGAHIPLEKIGPEHEDWGMEMHNGVPQVRDRARQHTCYAEAGSFGEFLVETYGTEKIKQFNRLSSRTPRPWQEAFGSPLEKLEADWLGALKSKYRGKGERVELLAKLLQKNPANACNAAQEMAK